MLEVLVPVDTSTDRALAQARTVADLPVEAVRAVLFHVFTDNPEGASVHQLASVRRAEDHLTDAGVDVTLASSGGDPVEETIARARTDDVDVICVAGRKRTTAGKLLFGSVSRSLLLASDRPVLFCTEPEDGVEE